MSAAASGAAAVLRARLPMHVVTSHRASCSFAAPSRVVRKGKPQHHHDVRGVVFGAAGRQQQPGSLRALYSSSQSGIGFGKEQQDRPSQKDSWKVVDVPLVFVPGMKGTHLAFDDDDDDADTDTGGISNEQARTKKKRKKKRAWLTLGNLLNFPPRPDDDPARDLSLPLTYDYDPPIASSGGGGGGEDEHDAFASHYPRQHRGKLVPDGIVDHIIELNAGGNANNATTNFVDLNFLPFYGHGTRMMREIDREYHSRRHDGKLESTGTFDRQDDEASETGGKGIFDRAGSFVERTSDWAFFNKTNITGSEQQSHHSMKHCRPTAVFSYDWRRPLPELCTALHEFCEDTFPDQPVQIFAHSLGGLMSFAAMREHPEKYAPGAVVVGVPFETGIQYLQDLHKGYYTELDRCRQFTPEKQFTMSSHWGFFPINKDRLEDRFVDVTERCEEGSLTRFEADKSGIGKKAEIQPKVEGENAYFDFYDPDEWERLQLGVFGPEYDDTVFGTDEKRQAYKEHMRIQMAAAKRWRQTALGEGEFDEEDFNKSKFPPFVACASYDVPTVNQILRRRRKASSQNTVTRKGSSPLNAWEYDYVSGRAVPGDGRIDYDKAFPPSFVSHKRIKLSSAHAKQMCWEESGGSLGRVYEEVVEQAEEYLRRLQDEKILAEASLSDDNIEEASRKNRRGRGRSMIKMVATRARNARKRLRRGRSAKAGTSDPDFAVSAPSKRLSFRRRRRRS